MKNKYLEFWARRVLMATATGAFLSSAAPAWASATEVRSSAAEEADVTTFAPLSESLLAAFNAQIGHEMAAAQTYLDLANYFNEQNLEGFGRWFTAQFYEELNHARQFMNYVKNKRQHVQLNPVQAFTVKKGKPLEVFQQALKGEEDQTKRIQALYNQSMAAGEYTAVAFLKFFLDEQVQEEDSFSNIVDQLTLLAGDPTGILALDRQLAARALPPIYMPAH